MAYNQNNSVTYNTSDHLGVNAGYTSVISASKGVTYKASKGFIMGETADCYITASDGTVTIIEAPANGPVTYNISIIGYNPVAGNLNNVTLLY